MIGKPGRAVRETTSPRGRCCFGIEVEDVGAAQQDRDEIFFGARSILGLSLDQGEIVILVLRRSWLIDAAVGVLVGVLGAGLVWAVGMSLGKPSPHAVSLVIGLVVGGAHFALEHVRRLYVLTDRRVIRHERGLGRIAHLEMMLGCVDKIDLVQNDLHRRLGAGSIVFGAGAERIVWSSVGDAKRVHDIATETVRRFGGTMRGM
jgi:hypothetical protein